MTVTKLTTHKWWEFTPILRDLGDFTTGGNLCGYRRSWIFQYGQLYGPELEMLRQAGENGLLEYVVFSYQTPIAWRINGRWVVTGLTHSVTTTRHTNLIATAISQIA